MVLADVDLNDLRKVVQDTLQSGGVLGKLRVRPRESESMP